MLMGSIRELTLRLQGQCIEEEEEEEDELHSVNASMLSEGDKRSRSSAMAGPFHAQKNRCIAKVRSLGESYPIWGSSCDEGVDSLSFHLGNILQLSDLEDKDLVLYNSILCSSIDDKDMLSKLDQIRQQKDPQFVSKLLCAKLSKPIILKELKQENLNDSCSTTASEKSLLKRPLLSDPHCPISEGNLLSVTKSNARVAGNKQLSSFAERDKKNLPKPFDVPNSDLPISAETLKSFRVTNNERQLTVSRSNAAACETDVGWPETVNIQRRRVLPEASVRASPMSSGGDIPRSSGSATSRSSSSSSRMRSEQPETALQCLEIKNTGQPSANCNYSLDLARNCVLTSSNLKVPNVPVSVGTRSLNGHPSTSDSYLFEAVRLLSMTLQWSVEDTYRALFGCTLAQRNVSAEKDEASGDDMIRGVSFDRSKGNWEASWFDSFTGRRVKRCFSESRWGPSAKKMAHLARKHAETLGIIASKHLDIESLTDLELCKLSEENYASEAMSEGLAFRACSEEINYQQAAESHFLHNEPQFGPQQMAMDHSDRLVLGYPLKSEGQHPVVEPIPPSKPRGRGRKKKAPEGVQYNRDKSCVLRLDKSLHSKFKPRKSNLLKSLERENSDLQRFSPEKKYGKGSMKPKKKRQLKRIDSTSKPDSGSHAELCDYHPLPLPSKMENTLPGTLVGRILTI